MEEPRAWSFIKKTPRQFFGHQRPGTWNTNQKPDSREERKYFSDKWLQGLLRICNYGCGLSLNLVVNGSEYGHIWVDDRGNDGGLYPDNHFGQTGRTKFLDWYELWLDQSLEETSDKP